MSTKKRKCLTIRQKIEIICELKRGEKNTTVCKKYNLLPSTVSTLWKNKEVILTAFQNNNSATKRIRKCELSDVDQALLQWFIVQKNSGSPISGPILKAQAEKFAEQLGHENFSCNNGWLDRFKNRHNIVYAKASREVRLVENKLENEWLDYVWPELRKEFNDNDIYNADETGLFYNMTPDSSLKFKLDNCIGGKQKRVTLLVCANMSGTDKKKLFVIGESAKPRSFTNVKTLPVDYTANKRAWMTSDVFKNFLQTWNNELIIQKRNTLLLVNNCPAHPHVQNLSNIKLTFFPLNTISVLQPLNTGVIHSFKSQFRRLMILQIIDRRQRCLDEKMSILDSIRLMKEAWDSITSSSISKCFQKSGLSSESILESQQNTDSAELPLSEWLKTNGISYFDNISSIDEFVHIDDYLATSGIHTEDDINAVKNQCDDENSDSGDVIAIKPAPSYTQAQDAMETLMNFFENNNTSDEVFNSLNVIKRNLTDIKMKIMKQTTPLDHIKVNENKLTVGKFEEVVINEAVTNGSVEATLQSTIKTERHDLDFDPFPSTSSSETTSQFAPDPEIVIKQETYDEDMVNSSFTKETNFDTEESGASPDHSVEILKFAESVKKQFENDPDWLFCLSLLPHLKRMLKIQRDNAKLNILDVIEKYKTL